MIGRRPLVANQRWWPVIVGAIAQFLGTGLYFYAYPVLLAAIQPELGGGRAAGAGAVAVSAGLMGLLAPAVAGQIARRGAGPVLLGGVGLFAAGLAALALAPTLAWLYVAQVPIGTGLAVLNLAPIALVATASGRSIGRRLGIVTSGTALAGVIVPPASAVGVGAIGWRATGLVLAALQILIVWPLIVSLGPAGRSAEPDPATSSDPGAATPEPTAGRPAWQSATFAWLAAALALSVIGRVGVIQHEVAFFNDRGVPLESAAGLLGLTQAMAVFARPAAGWLGDRVGGVRLLGVCYLIQAVGTACLLGAPAAPAIAGFGLAFGFALGVQDPLRGLLTRQLFDRARFGAVYGWLMVFETAGIAAGPPLTGLFHDLTGDYQLAWPALAALGLIAAGAVWLAARAAPRGPATETF